MSDMKLDLSVMDKISIPEVESLESFETKVESTEKDALEAAALEEVESLDEFESGTKSSTSDESEEDEPLNTVNDEESDSLRAIAKWGHELGIFDYDEASFESSEEYFKTKFFEKVKKEALESLPEPIQYLAQNYMEGVPLDELIASKSREMRFDSIEDDTLKENENLQESIVAQWLSLQDYDQDEVKDKLESYKDSLLLEKEAQTALKKLKKYEASYQQQLTEQAKEQEHLAKQEYIKQINSLKQDIDKSESFIPGIAMKKEDKEKLFMALTKRDREGKTELEKKMATKEMQLAVAQFVLQLDGKVDAVQRKAFTKAAQSTKEVLNSDLSKNNNNKQLDISIVRKALAQSKKQYSF
jgi:hypothetical protein